MSAREAVFTPRDTRVAAWVLLTLVALTAAVFAARQAATPAAFPAMERAAASSVPEAQPLAPTEALL